ncbi:SDR family oxidoreductase [Yonghaparkia sp. Soil809]|uniref:SDR family oxidoreductase n=1 Tax=Yonghaparkia sp. Soil809 TaxID=1736417 RepID=UPI0006F40B8B|nr:SDR family oxidoreductase [Yonghaparkia sp. Soil809]KRF31501.1 short-chain dehydrogenase [Yonghaparkia sp. Soil809]
MTKGLKKIKGATVVITGASSGIGRASALRFAKKGANVVLAARREEALREVAAECERFGAQTLVVPLDVTDAAAVDALADRVIATFGRIDVWVNGASVTMAGSLTEVPLEDFRRVLDVNVMGYVHGARAALRVFRSQKRGVLVNVSSVLGSVPQPYTAAYSMSKTAVTALSASIRSELRLDKLKHIHVVTVMPAVIDTPIFAQAANYTGRRVLAPPPVNAPQRVAREIVKSTRKPRAEVPVGSGGRALLAQHRASPESAEKSMATYVDQLHLSKTETAPATSGNLFESAPLEMATVEGGWGGRPRQAGRRMLGGALLVGALAVPAIARSRGRRARGPGRRRSR